MKCCINGGNVIRLLFLSAKLFKFEIQKCGQILCAHKPYFLMPGHNYPFTILMMEEDGFNSHIIYIKAFPIDILVSGPVNLKKNMWAGGFYY